MTSAVTQSTLKDLGHRLDPLRVFEDVRLHRCRGCGRIWRFKLAHNSIDALAYAWLKLLEPTGWTMTFDLPFERSLDEVFPLSPIEMLLWNAEPCPGPPTRDYPGAIENAPYRLVALGFLDSSRATPSKLQVKDALSVQVTNLLLVLFGDLQMAQPLSRGAIRLVRPVNRKEDVIDAER
jgi:hypothetical protein